MNLYDLKTPLTKMSFSEVTTFVRELRRQRELDHSPPKKEKKQKDPLAKLFKDPKQLELFLELLEKQKEIN